MKSKKVGQSYIVKLEKDDKVIETLTLFCKENQIYSGNFSGIGAVKQTTVGYYELATKSYHWRDFLEDHEVSGLLGNVTMVGNEVFLHAHINLSNKNLEVFGGHLKEAIVAVTLEVRLDVLKGKVKRVFDDEIGLKLMDIG